MILLQSLLGLIALTFIAWALSENRKEISWKAPVAGLALQLVIAVLLLKFPPFQAAFVGLNSVVLALQEATEKGTALVFGFIGGGPLPFDEPFPGAAWIFAFRGLPLILVMSALSALMFYWKILPAIVRGFAWVLRRTLGIGGAVGVSAAANVFVGMVEAPLFIRPYLLKLSRSELFMVMTCGLATVAGTVMVLYAAILGPVIDNVLGHILTASLISAPAAIMIARMMVPDDGKENTEAENVTPPAEADTAMEAVVNSTVQGITLILNIIAMLIVMVALVHLANMTLAFFGEEISIQTISGYAFTPIAWLMGIPWDESFMAGQLLGTRLVLTEFVAYLEMAKMPLTERTSLIMLYGLCGFASLPSLGIMIGGLGVMVPERRREIIDLGFKSVISATLATALTGGIVGLLG
ncbi:nucleoside transporter C-terminal domain-containing protein [Terasakiella sp. A23]|uniref:NupC/NupG family nucleoside CNT transporter n=1 Tax=Terasakiella sp. FCG-A23 TaxID=3080561 RepID=UPI002952A08D|nr:nucleoside transporter C-terminal domain-containing protein [Terasakiella sp. A23]MDV7338437.1 nucleoside transporter C-terminal domain-containing protein [Terasakiella sp. A23]